MPTEVICTIITGAAGIICAAMAAQSGKRDKRAKEESERVNRRAEQRAK